MRYDADHKRKTRERVVQEAAKAIRAEGPHQIAVAGIMAKAGLTHGGFYAHFASKDDLIVAAIGQMFEEGGERLARETEGKAPARGLADYIDFYLSKEHCDARTTGCPMPFMAADLPRLSAPAQARFAEGIAGLRGKLGALLEQLGHADAKTEASSVLAELVGALSLARAEPDRERSDTILARSKASLKQRFALEPRQ